MSLAMNEMKVLVDGKLIFSYQQQHRLPNPGEIVGLIAAGSKG